MNTEPLLWNSIPQTPPSFDFSRAQCQGDGKKRSREEEHEFTNYEEYIQFTEALKRRQYVKIESEVQVLLLFQGQKEFYRKAHAQVHQQEACLVENASKHYQRPFWPEIIKSVKRPQGSNVNDNKKSKNTNDHTLTCNVCEKNLGLVSRLTENDLADLQCYSCEKILCGLCSFPSDYGSNCCYDCR